MGRLRHAAALLAARVQGRRLHHAGAWWAKEVKGTEVRALHRPGRSTRSAPAAPGPTRASCPATSRSNRKYSEVQGDVYFSAKQLLTNPLGALDRIVKSSYSRPALLPLIKGLGGQAPATPAERQAPGQDPHLEDLRERPLLRGLPGPLGQARQVRHRRCPQPGRGRSRGGRRPPDLRRRGGRRLPRHRPGPPGQRERARQAPPWPDGRSHGSRLDPWPGSPLRCQHLVEGMGRSLVRRTLVAFALVLSGCGRGPHRLPRRRTDGWC